MLVQVFPTSVGLRSQLQLRVPDAWMILSQNSQILGNMKLVVNAAILPSGVNSPPVLCYITTPYQMGMTKEGWGGDRT